MYGLDLFSGIGGITLALLPWVQPVAYCEIEPYAQGVLLSNMQAKTLPRAPIWDDVRTLKGDMLPNIDIITGGFPCQDISIAGRGKGLEGERSGLFFEVLRLIDEINPTFIFLENVPAITTRGGITVVNEITARGYDCRWTTLSASEVGAPHKRERWWLLAHTNSELVRKQPGRERRQKGESAIKPGIDGTPRKMARQLDLPSWPTEPEVGRVADGISFRMDRIKGLGNSVVPQQARQAFKELIGI